MGLLVIDNAERSDAEFNRSLVDVIQGIKSIGSSAVAHYSDALDIAGIQAEYDGIVLSGVPIEYSLESIDERRERLEPVIRSGVPILAICLGHQAIGEVWGGEVIAMDEEESGLVTTRVIEPDPLFNQIGPSFKTAMMHWAEVTAPEGFVRLAETKRCKNAAMKYAGTDRILYGVQFHPELSPDGQTIFKNFARMAKAQGAETAVLPDPAYEQPAVA